MLGMRDKITKMGNKYGMEFVASEAYAKMMLGLGTQKEEDLWKLVELENEPAKQQREMAKVFHRQIDNQIRKRGIDNDEQAYAEKLRMTNSFVNLLDSKHFSAADKLNVISEMEKIDKKSYTTIKQSILVNHWKYHQEKLTKETQQTNDILNRSTDPEVQKYMKALREGNL